MIDYEDSSIDDDASSLTSEESHEPYFDTRTGAILTARGAWNVLAETDGRYRVKLEQRRRVNNTDVTNNDDTDDTDRQPWRKDGPSHDNDDDDNDNDDTEAPQHEVSPSSPSNEETASLGPSQSSIDRALHNTHYDDIPYPSPLKKDKSVILQNDDDDEEETDPDILRARAMALAAANGRKLTPEQIVLIARPDVQQQKLIEESRHKAKLQQQQQQQGLGIGQIGADIKKFIEGEKDRRPGEWGVDLGRFIEEQLHGNTCNNASVGANPEGKKKMEGFGSTPPVTDQQKQEEVRLSGILWKRRSGLGKHSTIKAWERRKVELRGNKLVYCETAEEGQASREREEDGGGGSNKNSTDNDSSNNNNNNSKQPNAADSTVAVGQSSGNDRSPSMTKKVSLFEQAAQNAEQRIQTAKDELSRMITQTVGFEGLASTNNVPRGTMDIIKENATICASAGHSGAPSPYCLSIKVKSETKWKFAFDTHEIMLQWLLALNDVVIRSSVDTANEIEAAVAGNTDSCRWEMQEGYSFTADRDSTSQDNNRTESMPRTFLRQLTNTDTTSDVSSRGDALLFRDVHFAILLVLSNLAMVLSRSTLVTTERWWNLVVFFNFGMRKLYCYTLGRFRSSNHAILGKDESALPPSRDAAAMIKLKSNAIAGSSCIKITGPEEDSKTIELGSRKLPTWLPVSSSEMEVRSHGYILTKKKVPSPGELYECIAVDCFQSDCRYSEMALRVVLPKVEFKDGGTAKKCWKSPDLFVVSFFSQPCEMKINASYGSFIHRVCI